MLIQDNASKDVLLDLEDFFESLVPMDTSLYRHKIEGLGDMPAHIKSTLTNSNLTLSIKDSNLFVGNGKEYIYLSIEKRVVLEKF